MDHWGWRGETCAAPGPFGARSGSKAMREHLRDILIIAIVAIILFVIAEQADLLGTDLSGRMARFIKGDF